VNTATTTFLPPATVFGDYVGTTLFIYKIRTTKSGGTGKITVQLAQFNGNGPKVGTDLTYSSTNGGLGVPVSDSATSTTLGTNVITFAANARSAKAGNDATIIWKLANDPQFETDTYTSLVTFTISTT